MKKLILSLALVLFSTAALADLKAGVLAYQRQDWDTAIPELTAAAMSGSPEAAALLGRFYQYRDDAESVKWSFAAATNGNPELQYQMGVRIDDVAFHLWRRNDQRSSAFFLKAAECFQMAAAQNYAPAQNSLGMLYEMGDKIPRNVGKGVRLYRLAARQGNAHGLTNLALMYQQGRGVTKNLFSSYVLYLAATKHAKPGDDVEFAQVMLGEVVKQISQKDVERANSLVADWAPGKALPGLN